MTVSKSYSIIHNSEREGMKNLLANTINDIINYKSMGEYSVLDFPMFIAQDLIEYLGEEQASLIAHDINSYLNLEEGRKNGIR